MTSKYVSSSSARSDSWNELEYDEHEERGEPEDALVKLPDRFSKEWSSMAEEVIGSTVADRVEVA